MSEQKTWDSRAPYGFCTSEGLDSREQAAFPKSGFKMGGSSSKYEIRLCIHLWWGSKIHIPHTRTHTENTLKIIYKCSFCFFPADESNACHRLKSVHGSQSFSHATDLGLGPWDFGPFCTETHKNTLLASESTVLQNSSNTGPYSTPSSLVHQGFHRQRACLDSFGAPTLAARSSPHCENAIRIV